MRSPACMSVAVRRPDGTIIVQEGQLRTRLAKEWIWKIPAVRGVATLVESFTLGYRALRFSAEQQMTEEEAAAQSSGSGFGGNMIFLISIVAALAIFKGLPQLLATGASWLTGTDLAMQDWRYHLVTGAFQLVVLVSYLALIGRVKEIRRVFQYHGAEHKTISAYEQGLPLTVENVRKQTTLHPRCGTTFLVIVVLVSIAVGSIAAPILLPNAEGITGWAMIFGLRLALLPAIAAVSYELQRLGARYCTTGPLRVFLWPGFLFQKITTREPDDAQIEIAIAAMQSARWREEVKDQAPEPAEPRVFPDLARLLDAFAVARPAA